MRIECPHCEVLVPAQIEELGEQAVSFRCGACDRRIEVTATAEPSQAEPEHAQTGAHCPKCKAPVASIDSACRACGLATERFNDFEKTSTSPAGSDTLQTAWSSVLGDWQSESRHEAFLQQVASSADYKEGARRYREASAVPDQKAKATLMLARIQSMAAAALLTARPRLAESEEPFRAVLMLLIALVLIAGVGGLYVFMKTKEQPAETRTRQFRTLTPSHSGAR